jgi:D-glycero-D-manno-heptose 1,7-bisphosphate phosphatase
VREYKDPGRPIIGEAERAFAVAALQCVDWVTFHDERRMRDTLEILKPTYYIKGGDYTPEQLTSRDVVEAHGGEVRILPLMPGLSTTGVIEKIVAAYGVLAARVPLANGDPSPRPCVFLDRDGVLNEEVHFLKEPKEMRMIAGVGEALARLRAAGFRLVVVTNQSGIGLGYLTEKDFLHCNSALLTQVARAGGAIDKFYFSPYSYADDAPCRKPGTAMIEAAATDLNLDLSRSWIVGDRASDIACGKAAGLKTVLVHTGSLKRGDPCDPEPDFRCADLGEAADIILRTSASE